MDLAPDGFGGHSMPPSALQRPEQGQRRRWLVEVWGYALFMAVGLGLVALLLTGEVLLLVPVVFVCLIAGAVGTVLAIQRSREAVNAQGHYQSIFH